jgi:signal transduction histidine kinase
VSDTRSARSWTGLIFDLRHDPVDDDGLVAALATHASGLRSSDGPTIEVQGPAPRLELSQRVETQLFAICREALSNVMKHARASAAHVRVEARDGQVVVEVRDDGRGFDPAAGHPGHFGLDSMRSRASEIGGRLTISSAPGLGTLVRVRVPVETDGT